MPILYRLMFITIMFDYMVLRSKNPITKNNKLYYMEIIFNDTIFRAIIYF